MRCFPQGPHRTVRSFVISCLMLPVEAGRAGTGSLIVGVGMELSVQQPDRGFHLINGVFTRWMAWEQVPWACRQEELGLGPTASPPCVLGKLHLSRALLPSPVN